jgi:Cu-processing system permease protein
VSRLELLAGKYAGLVVSIGTATVAGFGVAGIFIAVYASTMDATTYLFLLGLMIVLVAIMTGIGLVASVVSNNRGQAMSAALLIWFVAVLFFDLVLIGLLSGTSLGGRGLLAGLLLNPIEIVRVLAIMHLEPDLTVLGPFGSYLMEDMGKTTATAILVAALGVWVVAPVAIAAWVFNDRSA